MDLKTLKDSPLWDWPKDDGKIFLEIFSDDQVDEPERPLARATGHERIRGSRWLRITEQTFHRIQGSLRKLYLEDEDKDEDDEFIH